jgi:hypothetical protein
MIAEGLARRVRKEDRRPRLGEELAHGLVGGVRAVDDKAEAVAFLRGPDAERAEAVPLGAARAGLRGVAGALLPLWTKPKMRTPRS